MRSKGRHLVAWHDAVLSGVLALVVYSITLAPGLTFIDSGELATVATMLGVAHPTGYPLFTLIGHVVVELPFGPEPIVRLNVMAALSCALAVGVFNLLFLHLLSVLAVEKGAPGVSARAGALAGSLLLAFSKTFWSQAVAAEVYSLHLLLLGLTLLTFFRALLPVAKGAPGDERRWFIFAFSAGLCFTNHMTTVLLIPGLVYLYFAVAQRGASSWRRIFRMAPFFLLGLSLYLYLPLRASQSPPFNWGDPSSLERLLWHVTGKQYRVWIFSSSGAAGRQLIAFLSALPGEMAYVGLLLALIGVVWLYRHNRKVFWGTTLLFVGCIGYAVNYDIHDIDSYFLLAHVSIALWASFGIARLLGGLKPERPLLWHLGAVGLSLPLIAFHFNSVDESRNTLVENYTRDMFASLAPNTLVFSYQWDYWVSASLYDQAVRHIRPDVAVVDKELLRRSWYLKDLGVRMPWLIQASKLEVEAFRRELDRFEHGRPYDPSAIEGRYRQMIQSFIERQSPLRPVYVTAEIEPEFTVGWQRVPTGLAERLYRDTLFHPTTVPQLLGHPTKGPTILEQMVNQLYANALARRALYYSRAGGDPQEARRAGQLSLRFRPDSALESELLAPTGHSPLRLSP